MASDYRSMSRKFALHGLAVEMACTVGSLREELGRLFAPFEVNDWPPGFAPITGNIHPYESAEVLRHLSPTATLIKMGDNLLELYQEGERFWLIDERWGLAEINLLKGQWRSWVLPHPTVDPVRCAEMAILWPMAQLLRAKGLYLLPAASVARDDAAALIISPFGIEPELSALMDAGFRVIGQRWTAIREEEGKIALLHLPGRAERDPRPRLRIAGGEAAARSWIDLADERSVCPALHAFCDRVLMIEPGRRLAAQMKEIGPADAMGTLRSAWPIVELHPYRRHGPLSGKLARRCRCFQVQLSRQPADMLDLLNTMDSSFHRPVQSSQLAEPIPLTRKIHVSHKSMSKVTVALKHPRRLAI